MTEERLERLHAYTRDHGVNPILYFVARLVGRRAIAAAGNRTARGV